MNESVSAPEAATGTTKLAAEIRAIVAEFLKERAGPVTDKKGYAERWLFSPRHIDNFLAEGLPHLKIGDRRVRIVVAEADRWMGEQFGVQRLACRKDKRKNQQTAQASVDAGGAQ